MYIPPPTPHTSKIVPVLNYALRQVNVLGSGGKAPHILNYGTRRGWVVDFRPRPLYPQAKCSR